jgi:acetolactate synthase-1/3 small subunit
MKHTILLLSEDKPGVLNRVTSLLRRKRFNIVGITAGPTLQPNMSRFAITIDDTEERTVKIIKQIEKLIEVVEVVEVKKEESIMSEMLLAKFPNKEDLFEKLSSCKQIAKSDLETIVGFIGTPDEVDLFIEKSKPLGLLEISRSGITILPL